MGTNTGAADEPPLQPPRRTEALSPNMAAAVEARRERRKVMEISQSVGSLLDAPAHKSDHLGSAPNLSACAESRKQMRTLRIVGRKTTAMIRGRP